MSEGRSSSYEKLKSQQTLGEILLVAIEFERSARDFYSDLAPKVSKQIRDLVEELAEEEQRHFDLFSELNSRKDIEQQLTPDSLQVYEQWMKDYGDRLQE